MARYLVHRIGQALLVIWLAYTLVFLAVQLLPSDPVTIFLTSDSAVDQAAVDAMKKQYGYDQPLLVQYVQQFAALLRGDAGFSLTSGEPVTERIGGAVGSTLALAGAALGTAVVLALTVVAAASLAPSPVLRRVLVNLPPLFSAVPVFWLGLVLLELLSIRLGLLSLFPDGSFLSLAVPVFVLAVHVSAPMAQVLLKAWTGCTGSPSSTCSAPRGRRRPGFLPARAEERRRTRPVRPRHRGGHPVRRVSDY
ncbi:ABC transporter permease [Arthrobacter sp. ATA002]|uniref:ABC transporter permease n=1 Tax=Arthrobacter sp. ATA002 TaxID=2991715 RepID=UPI0022A72DB6|nr:ABC transporter permease [Arthrobacter sp. ATA002]WAP51421.1 ABC transporter permease [Arthrobacter sp. ATA002]